jgi:hypothetical protein
MCVKDRSFLTNVDSQSDGINDRRALLSYWVCSRPRLFLNCLRGFDSHTWQILLLKLNFQSGTEKVLLIEISIKRELQISNV